MTGKVDIFNQALLQLGVSQTLEAVDDRTTPGRICRMWYDHCLQALLRDFPWPFATRAVALSLLDTSYLGWQYTYGYPIDCLMVRKIVDRDSSRFPLKILYTDYIGQTLAPVKIPFQVVLSPINLEQRAIVCDFNPAYAICTFKVTNTDLFDPLFVDTLSWALAGKVGLSLQVDKEMLKNAQNQFPIAYSRASAQALNEMQSDPAPESPSITVR